MRYNLLLTSKPVLVHTWGSNTRDGDTMIDGHTRSDRVIGMDFSKMLKLCAQLKLSWNYTILFQPKTKTRTAVKRFSHFSLLQSVSGLFNINNATTPSRTRHRSAPRLLGAQAADIDCDWAKTAKTFYGTCSVYCGWNKTRFNILYI